VSKSQKSTIAFVRMEDFPLIYRIVPGILQEIFPEKKVELIEVIAEVKKRPLFMFINALFMLKEYGLDLLTRRQRLWNCFFGTTYFFKRIKDIVLKHPSKDDFAFVFQAQSLFDARLPGLPHYLYTDHTFLANFTYPDFDGKKRRPKAWIELEKQLYQNATLNFTRSTNISKSMIEDYGCRPEQVVCIYAGANAQIRDITLGNDNYSNKNILFVGIDWERKGGPELIEAFKKVLAVYPDAKLTIVGCSPTVDAPNVHIVGKVPVEQVHQYFEQASVFCLPTKLEPFGVVFVEALQYRLPIVGTNIGAIPDFITPGKNGYLVKPGSVDEIAQALIDLVGSPEKCRAFGEESYRIATENYTWERVKDRLRASLMRE
jgi:glycosyltransferase involved in cell wall biosynthesis